MQFLVSYQQEVFLGISIHHHDCNSREMHKMQRLTTLKREQIKTLMRRNSRHNLSRLYKGNPRDQMKMKDFLEKMRKSFKHYLKKLECNGNSNDMHDSIKSKGDYFNQSAHIMYSTCIVIFFMAHLVVTTFLKVMHSEFVSSSCLPIV